MRSIRLLLLIAIAGSVALWPAASGGADAGRRAVATGPVPSLEPAKTEALWKRLVSTRSAPRSTSAECRPLRAVFYAASDWLRLATKLRERQSACAEYYVSVPPLVADKTTFRPNQAHRIRALGPNFHAMAEVHHATWTRWVANNGGSWHAAGVKARENMAAAGYDVALGDTWALNELTTAVRRGDGNARANVREFIRGLYEGDGSRPTKGAVLVIGFGQRTGDVSVYQNTVQNWLTDTAFWTDMAAYVNDWSQEVYGDLRSHAVPGAPVPTRREYLNDYLQHKLVLASAGPSTIEAARAFLRDAHSPLANGAWPRDTAWGWTMVPAEQMSAYVSAQVNALRWFSATSGQSRDHWGFAWAPTNANGLSLADFAAQTAQILDRMSAAIRDSGDVVEPENPGSGACGPPGQDRLCAGDLTDARHTEAWRGFRTWSQAVLGFTTPAQTIQAGVPSGPITLALVTTTGSPVTTGTPRTVTLSSSSSRGTFATTPAGPWTGTLTLTVAPGAPVTFYYQDTFAGQQTLTATADGTTTGTHIVTVTPGAAVSVSVSPVSGEVRARGTRRVSAQVKDAFGNITVGPFVWQVRPAALGTIEPGPSGTAVFTASRLLGAGTITATSGAVSGTSSVTIVPARLKIGRIEFGRGRGPLRITLTTVDGARRPVSSTALRIVVKRDGKRHFGGSGRTGSAGKKLFRVRAAPGCFTVTVTRAISRGFEWDGRTPRNGFCRR